MHCQDEGCKGGEGDQQVRRRKFFCFVIGLCHSELSPRSARQARREETREKELKKKVGQVRRRISSGSGASHAPKLEDDQYGMAQLFLPDNAPKEKKGEPAKAASPTKIKKVHESRLH